MRRRSPKRARGGPWNVPGNPWAGPCGGPWGDWSWPPISPKWSARGRGWDPEDDLNLAEIEDPEDDLNLAEIEDPEDDLNLAEIEDPEDDLNLAEIEDPQFDRWGNPVVDPWGTVAVPGGTPRGPWGPGPAPGGGGCCCDEASDSSEPELAGCIRSGFVIVRLARKLTPADYESLYELAIKNQLLGLAKALEILPEEGDSEAGKSRILPSWSLVRNTGDGDFNSHFQVRELEKAAATSPWPPRHSLLDYWRVDLREHLDQLETVRQRLQAQNDVALAYAELEPHETSEQALVGPNTTSIVGDQLYLGPAPDGTDANWARQWLAASPKKVRLVDVEQSWLTNHKNLPLDVPSRLIFGDNRALHDHPSAHGVAVCGELIADGAANGVQLEGIARDVVDLYLASHFEAEREIDGQKRRINGNVAEAIVASIAPHSGKLRRGDILLLEVQRCRLPTELDPADLDAIRLASAAGIFVVEAAGNGGHDLDRVRNPEGRRTLARGTREFVDSGALLVGAAATARPHRRIPSSNYGRVVRAWADGQRVVTCGYGDFFAGGGVEDHLTDTFSGTSAASPILAGVAALLQSLSEQQFGERLSPGRLREILADRRTGTPQGRGVPGHIGVMPDLRAILGEALAWAPCLGLRKNPCDDGRRKPGSGRGESASEDLWSSPDIFWLRQGDAVAPWMSTAGRANPTPGPAWSLPGNELDLYVRSRNSGSIDVPQADVRLFHAPPATWIPPEMWQPAGSTEVQNVLRGGDWIASQPLPWNPPQPSGTRHYSWLAILGGGLATEELELPPGGRYFDPRTYLRFLRTKQVACRNVHRVNSNGQVLFWVVGAPDRARTFDFEVTQEIPAQGRLSWTAEPDLAFKLHRSLHGEAASTGGVATLAIPPQPCLAMRRVLLQRGACHPVELKYQGSFASHHGVVIRQLYRGREWGRLTFYFSPNPSGGELPSI